MPQKRGSRSSSRSRSTITTNQESTCSSTGPQELSLPPSSPSTLLDHAQSADATSFLGSVWNLVRDAKDLAARELDKLLEQFPYKTPSKSHLITNEDRILAVKKPGTSTTQASKSLLGHGPRMKRRGHHQPNNKNRAHTKRLLDQGFMALVNDVSSMGVQPMSPSVTSSILSEDNDALWEHSQSSPTPGSVSGSGPETGGSHSAKLLTAASSKHRPYHSSSSYRTKTQDVNGWESSGDGFQRTEESDLSDYPYVHQEPSAAYSIASMAEALSISGKRRTRHRQHNHRRHSVNHRGQKRHSSILNHAAQGRYGPLEERSNLDDPGHVYPISTAIYPQRPSSRAGSASGTETTRRIPSAIADPHTSMNISSREPTPTPFSSAAMSPESHLRESVSPATFEYEKLNELQQELAAIKVQLASLVSARQDDLQRSQFALGTLSPLPPPPPPLSPPWHDASALVTPKKRSPPANPAAQSMSNVLKELSSSGVHLRKTGSPYVSRISSAVDSAFSSEYTSVTIKSRQELEALSRESAEPTSPSPTVQQQNTRRSSAKPNPLGNSSVAPLKSDQGAAVNIGTDARRPSPTTLQGTETRPEQNAKELHHDNASKSLTLDAQSIFTRHNVPTEDSIEPLSHSLSVIPRRKETTVESKRKRIAGGSVPDSHVRDETASVVGALTSDHASKDIGPDGRLDSNTKKHRPDHPRRLTLHRSMTDPSQLGQLSFPGLAASSKHVSFQSLSESKDMDMDKDKERQWFRESDMESWRVGH